MVHGLDTSPQVSMKITSQQEDDINGNYFIKRCMSPAAVRRHKHFRLFLLHSDQLSHHRANPQDLTGRETHSWRG